LTAAKVEVSVFRELIHDPLSDAAARGAPPGAQRLHVAPVAGLLVALALGCAGCATDGKSGAGLDWFGAPAGHDDITSISWWPNANPWVRDADRRVVGLIIRAYFVSGATSKGEFVPGDIQATMSLVTPKAGGGYARVPLHEWAFDRRAAAGYRLQKRAVAGDSYGLLLRWPETVDVAGKTVELVLSYKRADGRVITSVMRQLRVEPDAPTGPGTRVTEQQFVPGAPGQPPVIVDPNAPPMKQPYPGSVPPNRK
jgi:hypothetical protein